MSFKVGDKVKCINADEKFPSFDGHLKLKKNQIYTIKHIYERYIILSELKDYSYMIERFEELTIKDIRKLKILNLDNNDEKR